MLTMLITEQVQVVNILSEHWEGPEGGSIDTLISHKLLIKNTLVKCAPHLIWSKFAGAMIKNIYNFFLLTTNIRQLVMCLSTNDERT